MPPSGDFENNRLTEKKFSKIPTTQNMTFSLLIGSPIRGDGLWFRNKEKSRDMIPLFPLAFRATTSRRQSF